MKNPVSLLCFIPFFAACSGGEDKKETPPNVIFILADDLGYNDLSCYREIHPVEADQPPTALTPNIDELARGGMMFTDFYCGAAVCSPSRAALITGRNATRAGIYNWIPPNSPMHLEDWEITLAEMLKSNNYHTGHFGKWHLTSSSTDQPLPEDQGFDHSFFTFNNANPSHENPVNFFRHDKEAGPLQGFSCQLVMDEALGWLDSIYPREAPFYMNIWFNEPHEKVAAPDTLKDRHKYRNAYYGCIENMDLTVGRLTDFLREKGLFENTLIFFSSDNGSQVPASNDPLRGEKCFNFEGGVRVPFIVHWKNKVPAGIISEVPGSFTDVMPSISSMTGSTLPDDRILDGEDLSGVFTGEKKEFEREKPIFFYRYFHDPVCMLREGDWILLGYREPLPWQENYNEGELGRVKPGPGDPKGSQWGFNQFHETYVMDSIPTYFELYNIREDVAQKNNLLDQHPEKAGKMKSTMLRLREEMVNEKAGWF